jgi:hypothetical protein
MQRTFVKPHFVRFHDGEGKSFAMLVTHEAEGEHMSGAVWCQDTDNAAGLSEGWNVRNDIGRGDETKGASWSPFPEDLTPGG